MSAYISAPPQPSTLNPQVALHPLERQGTAGLPPSGVGRSLVHPPNPHSLTGQPHRAPFNNKATYQSMVYGFILNPRSSGRGFYFTDVAIGIGQKILKKKWTFWSFVKKTLSRFAGNARQCEGLWCYCVHLD